MTSGACSTDQPKRAPMNQEKKRILIVDDEASITRLLKLNLEATEHYEVQAENDARKALASAETFRPHLILLDVLMPEMDGGQLASQLQASPKIKGVPIVFLTAAATKKEVYARGGKVGGLPFLAKPVDLKEVVACLEKFLGPKG
jgi:CheY-like chemotaxis protein